MAKSVTEGPFVSGARVSWMIHGADSISLCALHPTVDTFYCKRLEDAADMEATASRASRAVNRVGENGDDSAGRALGDVIAREYASAQESLVSTMAFDGICIPEGSEPTDDQFVCGTLPAELGICIAKC